MFIAALFMTIKIYKQPRCPSVEEWLNWYARSIEHYSAIKRKGGRETT